MKDLNHLTNDELVKFMHTQPGLTAWERLLVDRLEDAVNCLDCASAHDRTTRQMRGELASNAYLFADRDLKHG